jgi:thiamine biosynthesis protein ThiS
VADDERLDASGDHLLDFASLSGRSWSRSEGQGSPEVRIVLNGEERRVEEGLTVVRLLDDADPAYRHGLVEVNGELLPEERYDRLLVEGDRVEVILPAFGG